MLRMRLMRAGLRQTPHCRLRLNLRLPAGPTA
jgi:hypothetical protein